MKQLLIGIDVGSTTTKITVLNKTTESLLYSDYRRHHADQLASVLFAIRYADMAEDSFHQELLAEGERILKQVTEENRYAVIPASRPYQNDPLVNHNLPEMFTSLGIPVLTADAVPGVNDVDLTNSRLDVVNNYHARMLGSAVIAAENPHLEYVQIVSFGCGHDAYLSDEIIRLMKQGSGKIPLVLKLDESEIQGPLRIRVRSFIETVRMQREKHEEAPVHALTDPYPVKYEKKDRKERIVLIPNTSHAFCRVMSAAMERQGLRAEPLSFHRCRSGGTRRSVSAKNMSTMTSASLPRS